MIAKTDEAIPMKTGQSMMRRCVKEVSTMAG